MSVFVFHNSNIISKKIIMWNIWKIYEVLKNKQVVASFMLIIWIERINNNINFK